MMQNYHMQTCVNPSCKSISSMAPSLIAIRDVYTSLLQFTVKFFFFFDWELYRPAAVSTSSEKIAFGYSVDTFNFSRIQDKEFMLIILSVYMKI